MKSLAKIGQNVKIELPETVEKLLSGIMGEEKSRFNLVDFEVFQIIKK